MIVRALDVNGDWTFGKGKNNYLSANAAIGQKIQCRLLMWLGDCYFALNQNIDWWTILGSKDQLSANLAINAVIVNTPGVTGIVQSLALLDAKRNFHLQYEVTTIYTGVIAPSSGSTVQGNILLDQAGNVITDQSGNPITTN
jgi:hypothetical protein